MTPKPAASCETKKLQLLAPDQNRVQTSHEKKMKGLEDQKKKSEEEMTRYAKVAKENEDTMSIKRVW